MQVAQSRHTSLPLSLYNLDSSESLVLCGDGRLIPNSQPPLESSDGSSSLQQQQVMSTAGCLRYTLVWMLQTAAPHVMYTFSALTFTDLPKEKRKEENVQAVNTTPHSNLEKERLGASCHKTFPYSSPITFCSQYIAHQLQVLIILTNRNRE
jgi:hypothetical protein